MYSMIKEIFIRYLGYFDFLSLHQIFISPIVRIELLSFPTLSKEEEQIIEDLLSQFELIPILREIEDLTIQLKRQYKIKIPDAIIAATTLSQNGCLVTRNVDDFKGISGLNIKNPFIDEG